MPPVENGFIYELHPRPTKGEDGKPLLYPRPVIFKKFNVREFDAYCHEKYGVYIRSIENALRVACEACADLIKDGYRVETPFGSFALKLKLEGKHTDPDKVKDADVQYDGVEFIPSKEFLKMADCSKYGFRTNFINYWKPTKVEGKEALEQALRDSFSNGYTTVKKFMYKSGLKQTMARHYLNEFCKGETPLLYRFREGQTIQYRFKNPTSTPK